MIEHIRHPLPFLRIYPPDEQVFAEPVARQRQHLMPLVSVDLSAVNPGWQGWLHVVNPYEPLDGQVGDQTGEYHGGYVQNNWLAFRVDDAQRYHWLGDWRYFLLECDLSTGDTGQASLRNFQQQLAHHYAKTERGYQDRKAKYLAKGCLPCPWSDEPFPLVEQLGGTAAYDNWCCMGRREAVPVNIDDRDDVYPMTPDGERFQFVCSVDASHYGDYGTLILLFYHPGLRIALQTFNWS
ncbi:hypothetical protein [Chitinilyticum aquatile]|uniref:hypothetical protein n=1 Tax=Chitinilyticum aquatile TaxID=362520 RepID=UPI000424ACE5|nr:hypothetical protein [Chitinilyticum aquatile]